MHKSILIVIAFLCFNLTSTDVVNGTENEDAVLFKLATDVKVAVVRHDINELLKYVSPSGTYFIDTVYSYKEINESIRKKDSWLYKHLFSNKNSVKKYFEKAKDLKVKVQRRNDNAIFISYQSSDYDPNNWVECCFIRTNGKWYFDGIFSCR